MRRDREIHVVVVGSTNFDWVVKAERLPREGESMMVKDLQFFPGGKGANQAVAVARMGAKASFLSCVGRDIIGDFLIRHLESCGIDTTWVKRTPHRSTGCAFIMLFPNGNNCITVDPAANLELTPADVERAQEAIERADAVASVLEIPL
jgi:ribokinase